MTVFSNFLPRRLGRLERAFHPANQNVGDSCFGDPLAIRRLSAPDGRNDLYKASRIGLATGSLTDLSIRRFAPDRTAPQPWQRFDPCIAIGWLSP
jgi:hypothetical protein